MAGKEATYEEICRDIKAKKFSPIYVLMGEEPYFIDRISELLLQHVLNESERDFNQMILYGADTKAVDIINAARRFPMMSEYQLVVVREAQLVANIDLLTSYAKNPLASTILVIEHKYKKLDGRKGLSAAVAKTGVLFDSKKIPDYKIEDYIASVLRERAFEADRKAAAMLAEYLGNDLALLHQTLDKLRILLTTDSPEKKITPELIEKNVGISKEYNNFELQRAIADKDVLKANRIARYFEQNPNSHPIQATLPVLFNYFSNLLIGYYSKDRSERGLMNALNLRFPIQVKDYQSGLRNYSAMKVFQAIHEIRMADARSKGIDVTSSMTQGEIMKELLYKIMH
ncbi:DNA polymerase III subunit delta [Tannerella sp.]|uniref:DNA polymerase III subunit delta n=1 Tax=Tannerella sp. TaxID=2382127 RepID=UPI0026DCC1AB|nr:DNA polymerase III subunit delta [Tannerella sp.]MDO4702758.1 DNA polymerase III subunit delta [Tannerella sp.]